MTHYKTHYIERCEYGLVHSQCRCPDPAKAVHEIRCDGRHDRMAVVDAMTKAAIELGWVPISADSSARMITIIVRPRP